MLLISDNGTGFATDHFTADEGFIINNFTGKSVGKLVGTKEVDNYMCCDSRFKRPPTLRQKIKRWFHEEQLRVDHQIKVDAKGSLAETMKMLPKEGKK